jgi:hypothetical protein
MQKRKLMQKPVRKRILRNSRLSAWKKKPARWWSGTWQTGTAIKYDQYPHSGISAVDDQRRQPVVRKFLIFRASQLSRPETMPVTTPQVSINMPHGYTVISQTSYIHQHFSGYILIQQ